MIYEQYELRIEQEQDEDTRNALIREFALACVDEHMSIDDSIAPAVAHLVCTMAVSKVGVSVSSIEHYFMDFPSQHKKLYEALTEVM